MPEIIRVQIQSIAYLLSIINFMKNYLKYILLYSRIIWYEKNFHYLLIISNLQILFEGLPADIEFPFAKVSLPLLHLGYAKPLQLPIALS